MTATDCFEIVVLDSVGGFSVGDDDGFVEVCADGAVVVKQHFFEVI